MTGAIAPFAWIYNPINAGVGGSVLNLFDASLTISWLSYLSTRNDNLLQAHPLPIIVLG